jgi:hypothetical protein
MYQKTANNTSSSDHLHNNITISDQKLNVSIIIISRDFLPCVSLYFPKLKKTLYNYVYPTEGNRGICTESCRCHFVEVTLWFCSRTSYYRCPQDLTNIIDNTMKYHENKVGYNRTYLEFSICTKFLSSLPLTYTNPCENY